MYARTQDPAARARLCAVGVRLGDALSASAGRSVKSGDSATVVATLDLLARARTRGSTGAVAKALDHVDPRVRTAALQTLAASQDPDAVRLLLHAMDHWDPATRRVAARELGRPGIEQAVDPLVRILWKRAALRAQLRTAQAVHRLARGHRLAYARCRGCAAWPVGVS